MLKLRISSINLEAIANKNEGHQQVHRPAVILALGVLLIWLTRLVWPGIWLHATIERICLQAIRGAV